MLYGKLSMEVVLTTANVDHLKYANRNPRIFNTAYSSSSQKWLFLFPQTGQNFHDSSLNTTKR